MQRGLILRFDPGAMTCFPQSRASSINRLNNLRPDLCPDDRDGHKPNVPRYGETIETTPVAKRGISRHYAIFSLTSTG